MDAEVGNQIAAAEILSERLIEELACSDELEQVLEDLEQWALLAPEDPLPSFVTLLEKVREAKALVTELRGLEELTPDG